MARGRHETGAGSLRPVQREGVELTGDDVLRLPVRSRGIKLGHVSDLFVDLDHGRVLGIDVHCGDDTTRFLPLAAGQFAGGEIVVPSALVLLDEQGAAFYRKRAARFRELRGMEVDAGRLVDVVFDEEGGLRSLLVEPIAGGPVTRVAAGSTQPVARSASAS